MSQKLRIIIPLALLGAAGVAYAAHVSAGTLSAFGWESISLICPIGALGTMLASKMLVPRAVISIVLAVAAILLLGRAFCGWLCPVPVWSKLRGIFKKGGTSTAGAASGISSAPDAAPGISSVGGDLGRPSPPRATTAAPATKATPLSAAEKRALKTSCAGGCSSCADRKPADSRHIILGGTLLSAAIFGFPVFCLVCPVGLSFAMVFLLIALFGCGDVTWSVLIIPALIAVEVIFFRKWCSHLCPISSFMSLIGRANRTFQPAIDDAKCLETAHNATCGRCAEACEVGINPRHPELGTTMCARGTPSASRSSPARRPAPQRWSQQLRAHPAPRPSSPSSTLTSRPRLSRNPASSPWEEAGRGARAGKPFYLHDHRTAAQSLPDRPFPSSFDAALLLSRSFSSPSLRFGSRRIGRLPFLRPAKGRSGGARQSRFPNVLELLGLPFPKLRAEGNL